MIVCEALLISIIVTLGWYVTYTDFKNGIIENRVLLGAFAIGIIIQTIYLGFFMKDAVLVFLINALVTTVISVLLYVFHFWAAGDSKLLACIVWIYPIRLYSRIFSKDIPGFGIIVAIFLISYLYIILDTIIHVIKKDKFYRDSIKVKERAKRFLISYIVCVIYIHMINSIIVRLLPELYSRNVVLFSFMNVFLVMLISENSVLKKWYVIVLAFVANILLSMNQGWNHINVYAYIVLTVALVLKFILNGYNYEEIETVNVKKGMVLSFGTVMMLHASPIKGLPSVTFEDMRSRISDEEVMAIEKWRTSKYGHDKIVIVRKMPFAVFIIAGSVASIVSGIIY